jgi:hypothetical protein
MSRVGSQPPLTGGTSCRTMNIIRPRFIALDSSHLGRLADDAGSPDEARRKAADAFMESFGGSSGILVLSWHHFEELLRYGDRASVAQRVAFFQSLPIVASITPATGDDAPGSIIDILAFEIAGAFKEPQADPQSDLAVGFDPWLRPDLSRSDAPVRFRRSASVKPRARVLAIRQAPNACGPKRRAAKSVRPGTVDNLPLSLQPRTCRSRTVQARAMYSVVARRSTAI